MLLLYSDNYFEIACDKQPILKIKCVSGHFAEAFQKPSKKISVWLLPA